DCRPHAGRARRARSRSQPRSCRGAAQSTRPRAAARRHVRRTSPPAPGRSLRTPPGTPSACAGSSATQGRTGTPPGTASRTGPVRPRPAAPIPRRGSGYTRRRCSPSSARSSPRPYSLRLSSHRWPSPMERPLDPTRLGDHLDRLYRAAWAYRGSREDAEDLIQGAYARVLARPRWLRKEDDLGYLLRALRNTFFNQKRTERRRLQSGPLPEQLDLVADPHAREPQASVEAGGRCAG